MTRAMLGFCVGIAAWGCGAAPASPSLAERMAASCTTIDGCDGLLQELKAERQQCLVGPRPSNCQEREQNFLLVKQHLRERRELALEEANAESLKAGLKQRDEERTTLAHEHAELAAKPVATNVADAVPLSDPEEAWRALDPKRCAINGDEDTCYALLRYLNTTVDSPHRDEARAALEAGKKVIAERESKAPPGPVPKKPE